MPSTPCLTAHLLLFLAASFPLLLLHVSVSISFHFSLSISCPPLILSPFLLITSFPTPVPFPPPRTSPGCLQPWSLNLWLIGSCHKAQGPLDPAHKQADTSHMGEGEKGRKAAGRERAGGRENGSVSLSLSCAQLNRSGSLTSCQETKKDQDRKQERRLRTSWLCLLFQHWP